MATEQRLSPRSQAAWDAFRAQLEKLGATLVEPEWRGAIARHEAKCSAGHTCFPIPHSLGKSRVCLQCPGAASIAARERFHKRVEELGGEVLDQEWRGNRQKYSVRCRAGHVVDIWPIGLHQSRGICAVCSGMSPQLAWENFRSLVERLGGVVVEEAWKGKDRPHACLCPEGHRCRPYPGHLRRGIGMCPTCSSRDTRAAEAAFRARVEELGGKVLEPTWRGANKPHRVRCAEGHECAPWPTSLQQGEGFCRACAGSVWDVFYVVADEINDVVKFGITSGSPRIRLRAHAHDGFDTVVRLVEELPGDLAPRLERVILNALQDAGEVPVRGREYFSSRALGLILDIADGWTMSPPSGRPVRPTPDITM